MSMEPSSGSTSVGFKSVDPDEDMSSSSSSSMTTYPVPSAPPKTSSSSSSFETIYPVPIVPPKPSTGTSTSSLMTTHPISHKPTKTSVSEIITKAATTSSFQTLIVTYLNSTLITRTIRPPDPTPQLDPPGPTLALCNWTPASINETADPKKQQPAVSNTSPFTLSAFSDFLTSLTAAKMPVPDQAQIGFNPQVDTLYWLKELPGSFKECFAHLFDLKSDIHISFCMPARLQEKYSAYTKKLGESPPMKEIITSLQTIKTDIEAYLTQPSKLSGKSCQWKNPTVAKDSSFVISNIGEYNATNIKDVSLVKNAFIPLVGWYINIGGKGKEFQEIYLDGGANLKFSLKPKWDLIKTTFKPSNPKHTCNADGDDDFDQMSQKEREENIYPMVNSTIRNLRTLAEDIYKSEKNNRTIRILDERDGDCIRKICGGRRNLTVSICGFNSFGEFDQINTESQYAGGLGNRIIISEMVNFLRIQFEEAVLRHYRKPEEPDSRQLGPPLRDFMCSLGSANDTSLLPGTFVFNLGRRNGRSIKGCEDYKKYKKGCGNFRLEISSKPCTLLRPSCGSSGGRSNETGYSLDTVSTESLIEFRQKLEDKTITRKFAQNLLGETPDSWVSWTQGKVGDYIRPFDQFYCDDKTKIKLAVGIDVRLRDKSGVDYEVPHKDLLRGLDVLLEEFVRAEDPKDPIVDKRRISRDCSWNVEGLKGRPAPQKNSRYAGVVYAEQWGLAMPLAIDPDGWPWVMNITSLRKDDPCGSFSPVAS
ncbi:hypothetical protein TWF506_011439 [Arthrobotrys conoides]|uniref:Uncharacterized protein n=1 Tax=Arthrobotrys conoides TaxID=74498 RepID=A0AAN8PB49_9PEZI